MQTRWGPYKCSKTAPILILDGAVLKLEWFCYIFIIPGFSTHNKYNVKTAALWKHFSFETDPNVPLSIHRVCSVCGPRPYFILQTMRTNKSHLQNLRHLAFSNLGTWVFSPRRTKKRHEGAWGSTPFLSVYFQAWRQYHCWKKELLSIYF